ncbi:MAG: baseplate J/gp47 family protein [Anaerotignaceae bacterium]
MPLTSKGFERLTYNDIVNKKIQKAKELFGEDIDTSELTPLGKFIRINAFDLAEAEEEAEYIYYSIFPNTASGVSLDRLCTFVGISRNPATSAIYKVKVVGTTGYTVPIGFLVSTESGIIFYNIQDTEIVNGECEINVWCTQTGTAGNVEIASINKIVNPSADITSINGIELVSLGTADETDYELRKRFEQAREGAGACTEASIKAALMRVPTVTSAGVIVNDTTETDSRGRPPFSFECFVNGGENYHNEIAETIYNRKPIGIKTYGSISETVVDDGGYKHIINFSHTKKIAVKVLAKIKTDTAYEGTVGAEDIKDNLTTYINNLGVGESVILSALYGQIHKVVGVDEVLELKLSKEGNNFEVKNITVEKWEVVSCESVTVEVMN